MPSHVRSSGLRLAVAGALLVLGAASLPSCAEATPSPNLEDKARRVAPLPACIYYLPPKKNDGFVRQLRPDQYWKAVYPTFDLDKDTLPNDAADCTGRALLADWQFRGGDPIRGWPLKVEEDDIVFGGGGDRLKVVWLRSHHFADGDDAGALALVRSMDNFVEVYGVGIYKGRPDKTRLALERMGPEVIITADNDTCTGAADGVACEAREQVFLPRLGQLRDVADIALERRAYGIDTEKGARGKMEFRLTTAPTYSPGTIKLFEKVSVRDDKGRELRKAELERTFSLDENGAMVPSEGPLWPRIFVQPKPKK